MRSAAFSIGFNVVLSNVVCSAAFLLLAACENGIHHPTLDNLPTSEVVTGRIRHSNSPTGQPLEAVAAQLRKARVVVQVGSLDGDRRNMFGMVQDIDVDSAGNIYVLDSRMNDIRVFDKRGVLLKSFGRPGRGPDEFRAPEAMQVGQAGRLRVVDQGQLKEYRPDGDTYVYARQVTMPKHIADVCQLRDTFVTASRVPSSTKVIDVFDGDGSLVRSFRDPYKTSNPLVQFAMSGATIGCVPERGMVLFATHTMPYITAYSTTGQELWVSRIEDFRPPDIRELERDGKPTVVTRSDPRLGRDVPVTIESDTRGFAIVQVLRRVPTAKGKQETRAIQTYAVDLQDGTGIYVGDDLPIIRAIRPPLYFGFVLDPVPQMLVLQAAGAENGK